ncbi:protein WVD2-like 7 isoform X2 [Lycium ferocissimum]|uniref:protein WVD2-like 7 isoform X2 n=1 Tax=Lycium ferocissimum TaxID=112874 RepID=UPI002814AEB0|nr:protein WVD2-like 7 isoform X2 [Lycium ferocissimum]
MAESSSSYFLQSFSSPSQISQEANQGDPLRTSISFGRFMCESLDWEKWSSFTHNRYREEVEKYSKPGSVAEKKAYFEAHYKRLAAQKAAALLEQQQNAEVDESADLNITSHDNDHLTMEEETQEEEAGDLNVIHQYIDESTMDSEVTENSSYHTYEENNVDIVETEEHAKQPCQTKNDVEPLDQPEHIAEEATETIPQLQEKTKTKGQCAATMGDSVLSAKRKSLSLSTRLSCNNDLSKFISRGKAKIPAQHNESVQYTPTTKKNRNYLIDRKQSTPRSLHMSINCSSRTGEMNKRSSPVIEKIVNSRLASVNGISKHPHGNTQPEMRRTTTQLHHSFYRSRMVVGQSLSDIGNSNSSSTSVNKVRSSTVCSSFSLRSEERAAKRREFFQNLEQKLHAKEVQQAKPKGKATNSCKVMGELIISITKPNVRIHQEREASSNYMNKIPRHPCSPKFSRKTGSTLQDNNTRPPWRFSGKSSESKGVNNNLPRTQNPKLLLKESMRENTSPNIQA